MWWNKPKLIIDNEVAEWIHNRLKWIDQKIIFLKKQPLILPDYEFFPFSFTGNESDADQTLKQLGTYLNIDITPIKLKFYSEGNIKLGQGAMTKRDGTKGTAGTFQKLNQTISIEKSQLDNPENLVATLVHELCHYILMQLHGFYFKGEENEWMTDLLAVAYGFGIFMGNSKYNFQQYQTADGYYGWRWSAQGYLSLEEITYALAVIEREKGNIAVRPKWLKKTNLSFRKYYRKHMRYLRQQT